MNKNTLVACLMMTVSLMAVDAVANSHQGKPAAQKTHFRGQLPAASKSSSARHSNSGSAILHPKPVKPVVVAIDAGHGGKDTGAIGYNGTYEKDVVYAIARRLEALVRAEPGMRAVMVRNGDVFIALRERAEIARRAGADLFISVHADAHSDDGAKGSAVFTLSPRRVELAGFDEDTLEASDRAAGKILGELRKKQRLHCRHVQKARFAVLKSPDVPSMLIETGFVSNPEEERNLANPLYQDKVARSIFNGIRNYFRAVRPLQGIGLRGKGVVMASRQ